LLDPRMGEAAITELVDFSLPTLSKIAKSDIELEMATDSLKLIVAGKGTKAPLYWLGLLPVPRFGRQWMANVSTARTEIDSKEFLKDLSDVVFSRPA
jgi:hypothetical protein